MPNVNNFGALFLEMNYFVHKYICTHTAKKNWKTAIMGLIGKSICLLFYHFLFPLLNGFGFAWHLIGASGQWASSSLRESTLLLCKRMYNLVWFGIVSCGLFVWETLSLLQQQVFVTSDVIVSCSHIGFECEKVGKKYFKVLKKVK